ncbi:MAG: DUF2157 domain-containing protein [Alphaproteobacteria bacterium]|nr:DUF2157 domain-containing protein [Alphaproteobacteria bacterium]
MFKAKKLDKLVAAGIISAEQRQQILDFDKDKNSGFAAKLLSILGIFIIGVGVISIIAANWDGISDTIKLFVMFLMLFGSGMLAFYWDKNGMTEKAEKMLVGLFLLSGAAIGLIIQVYQLSGGKWYNVLLVWCLVTLPLLFALKKSYVAYFWVPVFLVWCDAVFWDWRGTRGLAAFYDPFGYMLWDIGFFAAFAFIGKMIMKYTSQMTVGKALCKYSLFAVYLCLALYIVSAWKITHISRLGIAIALLVVSGFVYRYYGAYHLIRRNIKFGGLVAVMFYVNFADRFGLLHSGIGLILSGVGLILLVKYWKKITTLFLQEKNND